MSELFEKSLRTLELPRVLQLLSDIAVRRFPASSPWGSPWTGPTGAAV